MKKSIIGILSCFLLLACGEDKKAAREGEPVLNGEDTVQSEFTREDIDEDRDNLKVEDETVRSLQEPVNNEIAGIYAKRNTEFSGCTRLEISFDTASELCVVPEEIYVSVKYEKADNDAINMFLVTPSNVENSKQELPWEEFDTDQPIAVLHPEPNGFLVLDWKGFHTNGEVATDYALIGKKTLEGIYEKE